MIAVMGVTASGKTEAAERLADRLGAVLVNADAFQVYRGLDIGTAKPEHRERYRLIDILDPSEPFGVGDWVLRATEELRALWSERRHVIVVGGTGQYVRALFEEFRELHSAPDPELRRRLQARLREEGIEALATDLLRRAPEVASRIDPKNPVRVCRALERLEETSEPIQFEVPPFRKIKFEVWRSPEDRKERIRQRIAEMIARGWREEVESLVRAGVDESYPALRAIGYFPILRHLQGRTSWPETVAEIEADTLRYAKRQLTWLKAEPGLIPVSASEEVEGWLEQSMPYLTTV
ncbi:MAG: tRNA (adenosine(37)-N6)-dimethylallyltransferase MiaA [Armatimonadetes bacterium]|nr:MAG: tRNA (adenosine(37)-N6)-dimethylallyltransferase MiaA [Armatimonadota bacterium]